MVPFWPAPLGQVEKGKDVANMNLSMLLSPSLGVSRACTDSDGCTKVQLDDVSDSHHPDEDRQDRGAKMQSQYGFVTMTWPVCSSAGGFLSRKRKKQSIGKIMPA